MDSPRIACLPRDIKMQHEIQPLALQMAAELSECDRC